MPTIRISKDHYQRLERAAVKATTERKEVVSIGQIAAEVIEEGLKHHERNQRTDDPIPGTDPDL